MQARRLCLFLALYLAPVWAQDVRKLTILHTNDLHAHLLPDDQGQGGFAYLATALRQQRANCSGCLYLNAGDLVQGTPVSTIFHGLPVYEIANRLGIDVSTLGNHEFDYGWREIRKFSKIAKFPVVCSNVQNAHGDFLAGQGHVIRTVNGMRIAIVGVVMGNLIGTYATPDVMGPWKVLPVVDAVRREVADIGARADIVVVLGHILDSETEQILHDIPEVSVIIAGHGHSGYKEILQYEGRVAVECKGYGVELGRLELSINFVTRKIASAAWKRIPIDSHQLTPAPDLARAVSRWESKVSKIVDVPIGESRRKIARDELRALVERAMAEETAADLAWINRGNVRDVLPAGRLLARHVWNILPFDNKIVIGRFKGAELPPVIAREHTIDPEREYTVATTDFTAINQSSPDELNASGLKFSKTGPLQRDAVLRWIQKKKVIE